MDDLFIGEARLLRERIAAIEDRFARLATSNVGGTHRMIGRVFSQGAIPTTAGKFYACHPVTVTGDETEGSTPVLTVDTDQAFLVDLLGGSAVVGDDLVCRRVRHRWVATRGASTCTAAFTGTMKSCGSSGVPSLTVTLKDHATGDPLGTVTTDASGNFSGALDVSGAPGSTHSIDFTGTGIARFADFSFTKTLTCGGANALGNLTLTPATGYHCCNDCAYPLKDTLQIHDSHFNVTLPLTWTGSFWVSSGSSHRLNVNGTLTWSLCASVITSVNIATLSCPPSTVYLKFIMPSNNSPCVTGDFCEVIEI